MLYARAVERRLKLTVFADGAVQPEKYHIGGGTHLEHTGADESIAVPVAAAHRIKVGFCLADGA